ncbi:MAG: hypothetical protein ACOCP8_03610 [archaeon]
MSYFILKNLKLYQIDESTYAIVSKGDDNNVFPKDYSTWHLNVIKNILNIEKLKKELAECIGTSTDISVFYNAKDLSDLIDMAIKTMGTYEELSKITFYRSFSSYYNKENLQEFDEKKYKAIEDYKSTNYRDEEYRFIKAVVTDLDTIIKESSYFTSLYAKKGVKNTLKTAFDKRFIKMSFDDLLNYVKEKNKPIKCQLLKNDVISFLNKTFYIEYRDFFRISKRKDLGHYYYGDRALEKLKNKEYKVFI